MSKILFETPQIDELIRLSNAHWQSELFAAGTPFLDADEDETGVALTLSTDLPYRAAFDRYNGHVQGCTACQDTPVWDIGCETGARLAHISADAMAAQEDQAAQN